MPLRYLRAFNQMKPILEAREALQQSAIAAYAGGRLKRQDANRIEAAWRRQANRKRVAGRRSRAAVNIEALARLGIPVKFVERAPPEA